jgi:hypothetical protein
MKNLYLVLFVIYFCILPTISFASKAEGTPIADFEIPETGMCLDSTVTFKNLGHSSNTYIWKIDGTTVATTFDLEYKITNTGKHYISLIVDSNGYTNFAAKEFIPSSLYIYHDISVENSLSCKYSNVEFTIKYPSDHSKYQLWRADDNVLCDENIDYSKPLILVADSVHSNSSYFVSYENTCFKKNTDTFYVEIIETPKDDLTFSYRDTILCNSGTPVLNILNTEINTIYTTNRINCYNCFTSDTGNGGQITLSLPEITEDKGFEFFATNISTGCKKYYSEDTIKVDTVNADFVTDKINIYTNEPLLCTDISYGNPTVQWIFDSDAKLDSSNSAIVKNEFENQGLKKIKLLNETEYGCIDSIEKTVYVHDTTYYNKAGWLVMGGRVDKWDGHGDNSFFCKDNSNNIYVTSRFERNNDENVVFSSYKGYNPEAIQKRGTTVTKYDAFGLLRWQNTIYEPIRSPKIRAIKNIHDSLLFVSYTSDYSNVEVSSTDGNKIQVADGKTVIVYNIKGEFIRHFVYDKPVSSIETDNYGNIYMVFSHNSDNDCYITKYSSNMDSLWTVYFSHSYHNNSREPNISIDPLGNILVVGSIVSDMTVNATNGDYVIHNSRYYYSSENHYNDIHFFKLSENGEYLWGNIAFKIISVDNDNGIDIASDSYGSIYVLCSSDIGKLYVTSNNSVVDSINLNDYTLLKYNSDGSYAWSVGKKPESGGHIFGHRLTVDSKDNIHVVGTIVEKGEFTSTDTLSNYIVPKNKNESILFIAKYDNNGVFKDIWQKKQRLLVIDDLIIDADTNFNVLFKNSAFSQDIEMLNTNVNLRPEEFMLVKFNKDFCEDSISILDMQIDTIACKDYLLSISFRYYPLQSGKNNYIVELSDNEGSFHNPKIIGSLTTSNTTDTINCTIPIDEVYGSQYRVRVMNLGTGSKSKISENDIVFNIQGEKEVEIHHYLCKNDSILINGIYYKSPGIYVETYANDSGCDSITRHIVEYKTGYLNVSSCDEYTSPSGLILRSSGIYYDTILTPEGCDSIITIELNIVQSTASEIQPVVCNSYTSPSGKHNWTESGSYTDTINNNIGCDSVIVIHLTVDCTDLTNNKIDKQISIYPNPTKEDIIVYFEKVYETAAIAVKNLSGQVILSKTIRNTQSVEMNIPEKKGVYLIEIKLYNNPPKIFRIIKI